MADKFLNERAFCAEHGEACRLSSMFLVCLCVAVSFPPGGALAGQTPQLGEGGAAEEGPGLGWFSAPPKVFGSP